MKSGVVSSSTHECDLIICSMRGRLLQHECCFQAVLLGAALPTGCHRIHADPANAQTATCYFFACQGGGGGGIPERAATFVSRVPRGGKGGCLAVPLQGVLCTGTTPETVDPFNLLHTQRIPAHLHGYQAIHHLKTTRMYGFCSLCIAHTRLCCCMATCASTACVRRRAVCRLGHAPAQLSAWGCQRCLLMHMPCSAHSCVSYIATHEYFAPLWPVLTQTHLKTSQPLFWHLASLSNLHHQTCICVRQRFSDCLHLKCRQTRQWNCLTFLPQTTSHVAVSSPFPLCASLAAHVCTLSGAAQRHTLRVRQRTTSSS